MLLSDPPSSSSLSPSSSTPSSQPSPSLSPYINGNPKLQNASTLSREFAVATLAASNSNSRSDSVPVERNCHSLSSSPIHLDHTADAESVYTSRYNQTGIDQNRLDVGRRERVREPPQLLAPLVAAYTNGIAAPPSPVISLSESSSGTYKTPMELLAESMKGRMLFAIPKKGRLYTKSLEMLEGRVFLPASDISRFVAHGNVDMGITGQDTIVESRTQSGVTELLQLGFGACKLQVQVPEKGPVQTLDDLQGKRIVSSYTTLARDHFRKLDKRLLGLAEGTPVPEEHSTKVEYVGGSVEAACALGLADGIVDLVESGETMRAAGLKAIDTVMTTEAVLIKSSTPKHAELVPLMNRIASRIAGFVASNKYVICQYNIPRELLPVVTKITPGRRAPTISSIEDDGWVAVSAMVEKKRVAIVMDELVEAGAEDTFIVALQNCRVETRVGNAMNSSPESPVVERSPYGSP
ncbi:hypothetical protein M408DRAFT_330605 [Serendipita vermifera MAFF 305830]|uniref:ATP phosphoribosyltransferase n=1 Tax=Serendipita vermifera MAFF 305830 TaxID=933852 RepID=A0A0C3B4M7_SERVB|nr:hypothetical protein M408DRAFT_330605 [Serendipita vermifera MAFF 305830]